MRAVRVAMHSLFLMVSLGILQVLEAASRTRADTLGTLSGTA